ncbi:hypothetical protein KKI23_02760 [Patescibacteria group bacterium]|nr:hypothetical protein [Patescibacteria group bacterium]
MNYLFGIFFIIIGIFMIIGTEPIMRMFGRSDWAEQHMSTYGGTRMYTKLIGLGLILLGFIFMGGWFGPLLRGIFSAKI